MLRPAIPGKGKILNQLTNFWFELLGSRVRNHLVEIDPASYPGPAAAHADLLRHRSVLVRKAKVVPFECVARGYLAGSGYREYTNTGNVCGLALRPGLRRADRLDEPIFTPATKAETGHDENVTFQTLETALGADHANELRALTLDLYDRGRGQLEAKGLLLADTKFEFGLDREGLLLIDEVLTPDSSRFWDAEQWSPGTEPVSFDKQFVRNWLDESGWDRDSSPPSLPLDVVEGTLDRYVEAFRRITGSDPLL